MRQFRTSRKVVVGQAQRRREAPWIKIGRKVNRGHPPKKERNR
ncbi:MAG TPA: hypothetical protein VK797_23190 [Tepidisphaeraceae bacterium]|nr:hypothetical protein [Tepidisphaeraceae bacterium]